MELRATLGFLHRRWWLLILGPVAAGLAAYLVTLQLTPVYRASATLLVNQTQGPGPVQYTDILTSERLTNTYAQLVRRPAVLDDVIRRLNLSLTSEALESRIAVAPIKDTQLLRVDVRDPDPHQAALIANTTAAAFRDDNASQLSPPGAVSIVKDAAPPSRPASPNLTLNLLFAGLIGLVAAAGLGMMLDYLDDTVKSAEDVATTAGLPTLGKLGQFDSASEPLAAARATSPAAEAYRQLRTNVLFSDVSSQLKTILITSAHPREGKSTTAANLAVALAQAGDRVILVDADLRRASLLDIFKVPNSFGLTGLLLNDVADPSPALIATPWENLRLLPAGPLPPNPSELLTSARMERVIAALRAKADYVIFDSPPVLAVSDSLVLAARMDGTILVTEAGRTRSDALRDATRMFEHAGSRLIGVALNKVRRAAGGGYGYGYDYGLERAASPRPTALRRVIRSPRTALSRLWRGATRPRQQQAGGTTANRPAAKGEPAQLAATLQSFRQEQAGVLIAANGANGQSAPRATASTAAPHTELAPLKGAVSDLLLHLDETVDLLKSMREKPPDPDTHNTRDQRSTTASGRTT